MSSEDRVIISKRLSFVLRHRPDTIGMQLDDAGWVEVDHLLDALALHGQAVSLEQLHDVVASNSKQRFEFNAEGTRLRARQGHSVQVQLGYEPVAPPAVLFHGTPRESVAPILTTGLEKRRRHHVHLSTDRQLMLEVARRRGAPALIRDDAARMHEAGFEFLVTGNDVWLTEHVPPEFLAPEDVGAAPQIQ